QILRQVLHLGVVQAVRGDGLGPVIRGDENAEAGLPGSLTRTATAGEQVHRRERHVAPSKKRGAGHTDPSQEPYRQAPQCSAKNSGHDGMYSPAAYASWWATSSRGTRRRRCSTS